MNLPIKILLSFNERRFFLSVSLLVSLTSRILAESFLKRSVQLHFPFICKIMGTREEPFQESNSSLVWNISLPFHSRKTGVSCFSEKKQVPASPWYHFLSFLLYYYMRKLAVFSFLFVVSNALPSWLKLYTLSGNLTPKIERESSGNSE